MSDETTKIIEQKKQTIAELQRQISVMEAFLAGKTILAKPHHQKQHWIMSSDPVWLWAMTDYKVAPEPRVVYMAEHHIGGLGQFGSVDECMELTGCDKENVVKFVEVL